MKKRQLAKLRGNQTPLAQPPAVRMQHLAKTPRLADETCVGGPISPAAPRPSPPDWGSTATLDPPRCPFRLTPRVGVVVEISQTVSDLGRARLPLRTEAEKEVTMPLYRQTFVAAATRSAPVGLEGSHGKLSGSDLRGHNRSHGAHTHPVADAGAPRVAGLRPASASARRPAPLHGAGRRNPQLLCSVIGIGRHRPVTSAPYPLGRHPVAHNSGGRC